MKFIKKQLALWHIVLIIGLVAMALPIAAHVHVTTNAVVVNERQDYWRSRLEKRLDARQAYIESQGGADDDDDDAPASKNSRDDADDADDGDDGDDDMDSGVEAQQDVVERRRDLYRQRMERRW